MHLSYSGGRGEGEEQLSGILLCVKTAAPCLSLEDHVMLMSMKKQKDHHALHNAALCHTSSKQKAAHCAGAGFLKNVSSSSTNEAQVSKYRRSGRRSPRACCGTLRLCRCMQPPRWSQPVTNQNKGAVLLSATSPTSSAAHTHVHAG